MKFVLSILSLALFAAVSPADEKADDWKKLKGTWIVEKAFVNGADSTESLKNIKMTLDEGKYTADFAGEKDAGKLDLDPAKKPKAMNIESTEGTNKGKKIQAIYEITGDSLKVAYSFKEDERPKSLEPKEGDNQLIVVYKREKK
jgi:uncharacterized protein (TIGR03067 family)